MIWKLIIIAEYRASGQHGFIRYLGRMKTRFRKYLRKLIFFQIIPPGKRRNNIVDMRKMAFRNHKCQLTSTFFWSLVMSVFLLSVSRCVEDLRSI